MTLGDLGLKGKVITNLGYKKLFFAWILYGWLSLVWWKDIGSSRDSLCPNFQTHQIYIQHCNALLFEFIYFLKLSPNNSFFSHDNRLLKYMYLFLVMREGRILHLPGWSQKLNTLEVSWGSVWSCGLRQRYALLKMNLWREEAG